MWRERRVTIAAPRNTNQTNANLAISSGQLSELFST